MTISSLRTLTGLFRKTFPSITVQPAGCTVIEGNVLRNKPVRVLRDEIVIFEGELDSLRRFKEDVNEVKNGTECGMGIKNYKDIKPGDKIEVYDRKEEAQSM